MPPGGMAFLHRSTNYNHRRRLYNNCSFHFVDQLINESNLSLDLRVFSASWRLELAVAIKSGTLLELRAGGRGGFPKKAVQLATNNKLDESTFGDE